MPRALGLLEPTHTHTLLMLRGFADAKQLPVSAARITLLAPTAFDIPVLSARLIVVVRLEGIRYYMYHWFWTCAIVGSFIIAIAEAIALIIFASCIYLAVSSTTLPNQANLPGPASFRPRGNGFGGGGGPGGPAGPSPDDDRYDDVDGAAGAADGLLIAGRNAWDDAGYAFDDVAGAGAGAGAAPGAGPDAYYPAPSSPIFARGPGASPAAGPGGSGRRQLRQRSARAVRSAGAGAGTSPGVASAVGVQLAQPVATDTASPAAAGVPVSGSTAVGAAAAAAAASALLAAAAQGTPAAQGAPAPAGSEVAAAASSSTPARRAGSASPGISTASAAAPAAAAAPAPAAVGEPVDLSRVSTSDLGAAAVSLLASSPELDSDPEAWLGAAAAASAVGAPGDVVGAPALLPRSGYLPSELSDITDEGDEGTDDVAPAGAAYEAEALLRRRAAPSHPRSAAGPSEEDSDGPAPALGVSSAGAPAVLGAAGAAAGSGAARTRGRRAQQGQEEAEFWRTVAELERELSNAGDA